MEKDEDILCPHCKKEKMRERFAEVNVNIPDRGDTTELVCDLCRHRIVKVDVKETIKLDDTVSSEKNPL
jgi:DNA-directed RNA polymerase subunit RPC12/RpoP